MDHAIIKWNGNICFIQVDDIIKRTCNLCISFSFKQKESYISITFWYNACEVVLEEGFSTNLQELLDINLEEHIR